VHRRVVAVLLAAALSLLAAVGVVHAAAYDDVPEDYASYQPQTTCRKAARPGTVALAAWLNVRFDGGTATPSVRPCNSGGTSEHKDGRAIDWTMDAGDKHDRLEVAAFLERVFATDGGYNDHALARRMGIMYVIWNDRMYASYDEFAREDYRSSSCPHLT
jgi:hypothetical protein